MSVTKLDLRNISHFRHVCTLFLNFLTANIRYNEDPAGTGHWSASQCVTLVWHWALSASQGYGTGLALGTECQLQLRHWPPECQR